MNSRLSAFGPRRRVSRREGAGRLVLNHTALLSHVTTFELVDSWNQLRRTGTVVLIFGAKTSEPKEPCFHLMQACSRFESLMMRVSLLPASRPVRPTPQFQVLR